MIVPGDETAPVGVVLAGGASSRMGTDKALVEVDGLPMARRVADALRGAGCDPVECQGGDAARLGALGLVVVPDPSEPDGRRPGPVGAIAAARARHAGTLVVAACDLPAVTPDVVRDLIVSARTSGRVAVAGSEGRRHLLACWPPSSASAVATARAAGVHRYHELLDLVGAERVDVDDRLVRNVNRPEDIVRAPADRYPRPAMTVREVNVEDLADLLPTGVRLFDVREPDEYVGGRVPGARLVPLATVPTHVDEFRGDAPVFVICRSGGRSMQACMFLAEHGIEAVNVAGGTLAWIDAGHPIDTGPA